MMVSVYIILSSGGGVMGLPGRLAALTTLEESMNNKHSLYAQPPTIA